MSVDRSTPAVRTSREVPGAVPAATVARLPLYLRVVLELAETGVSRVSSDELATATQVSPAMLRKDLSYLGSLGTRGVGYEVDYLAAQLSQGLGLTQQWNVAVVGMGSLGLALAKSQGFTTGGFHVAALFDVGARVGTTIDHLVVQDASTLAEAVRDAAIAIGVITTPADVAQEVCDRLIAGGVRSILNFAPVVLSVPEHVQVRAVDLSTELQILAFHQQHAVVSQMAQAMTAATAPVGGGTA